MRTAVLLLLLSTLVGCGVFAGSDCTETGSVGGVGVELAPDLQLVSGTMAIIVCDDDDCGSFEEAWARRPKIGALPSTATFDDLGRSFGPGTVHVTAEQGDEAGTVVARREQDVELSRVHPNGEDCDGDGWVNGGSTVTREDAVAAPSYADGMPQIATNTRVSRDELLDFVRTRHHLILVTTRHDGRPQLSPVTGGVDDAGRIVISTYPDRAKTTNLRRDPQASVVVLSDEWDDAWVQVDGTAEVLDMPSQEAEDGLVEYFRCISGEHPDWEDYRQAMRRQGKSLVRITPDRWGPVATGGFPADRVPS